LSSLDKGLIDFEENVISEALVQIDIAKNQYNSRTSKEEALVDTERGVNQYQVQFKNLFQLILKPFNYIQ
jgi:hypothetical protein